MRIFHKIWFLLLREQRRSVIVLLGLMTIGMILEMLGVGLVIPALTLMTQTDLATSHPITKPIIDKLGNPSHEQLVVAGMLILVGVYTIKALFLAFLTWQQSKFIYWLQSNISERLFIGYLCQPYTFHLQRNSAELIRNTITQVSGITSVIQQGLVLITEVMVLAGISVLLITVEPIGALLVMGTFGLASWVFNSITKDRLLIWGEARQYHEGLRIQHLQQGLGGAKDVKLLGRENDFIELYRKHNTGSAHIGQRHYTLQALPRLWLELLAVIGLAVLVIIMLVQGKPLSALLPTLGLFAAAAFRLMPSANRVLSAIQNIRYALPIVDTLHGEISSFKKINIEHNGQNLLLQNNLVLENISFQYQTAEKSSLQDISLSIPYGTTVGFIGGSGAGKSTLVDVILGLLIPSSGMVKVDGIDIQSNLRGWQDQIGYVPQSIFLTDDTLRRNIAFGIPDEQIDDAAVWKAIHYAQLEQFINDQSLGLDTVVGERGIRISGGQRQRIGIARALYHEPPVLVLDEATSSLDMMTEHDVMNAVNALHGDKTILIVAHRLSTVENCDRLFRLEKGCLVEEGDVAAILK